MSELLEKVESLWQTIYNTPELNMNNYNSDDVEKLNDGMIDAMNQVDELLDIVRLKDKPHD